MELVGQLLTANQVMLFSCRGGKYTEDDAKAVMIQILNVVAFCHLQGVVHRDLKPEVRMRYSVTNMHSQLHSVLQLLLRVIFSESHAWAF
jgi:hypothetical protein